MSPERSDARAGSRTPALQAEPLLRALADHDIQFAIIGGFALSAHGVVRATKDIDIVPDSEPANLRRLAAALHALDAEVLLADDFDPAELGIEPNEHGLSMGASRRTRSTLPASCEHAERVSD